MSSDKLRLDRLAQEFVERHRRGEQPTVSEYAEKHPDLADQIRELFPTLLLIERGGPEGSAPELPRQLGEYRILGEVGRGGMGVVYEAEQVTLGRRVALKVLPSNAMLDPQLLQRFRREAQAAAKLHHTNIVPVFGVGEHEGMHFFAMQFIQGRPLDKVIEELRRLRTTKTTSSSIRLPGQEGTTGGSDSEYFKSVARIGLQVADALAYAHGEGVLHRDIKPSNLLLDAKGTVWITDFGLARAEGTDNLTQTGAIVGTLAYMAPERFEGRSDPRSDTYSLGLTLYELLTLRPAFRDSDYDRLIRKVLSGAAPRPRKRDRRIPRDLETIVLKMTEREPDRRYGAAAQAAEDLRRFLEGRPILARRSSNWDRVIKWTRRHPATAALIVVSVAAAATLLVQAALHGERLQEQVVVKGRAVQRAGALALANESRAAEEADPMLALLLACEAGEQELLPEVVTRLHDAVLASRERTVRRCAEGPVKEIAVSPTGRHVLTRSGTKEEDVPDTLRVFRPLARSPNDTVRLWTLEGECRAVLTNCTQARFSPAEDRVLAVCDGKPRLLDLRGKEVALEGHAGEVVAADFSPDGKRVLTASLDRSARLWDLDGTVIARFEGHAAEVVDALFSPDGRHVLTVEFPVAEMTRAVERVLGPKPYDRSFFAWTESGVEAWNRRAGTSGGNGAIDAMTPGVRIWESTGKALARIHDQVITSAFFDARRDRVYTVSTPMGSAFPPTMAIRAWSFDGKEATPFGLTLPLLTCAALTPDGTKLLASSPLGGCRVWDVTSEDRTGMSLGGQNCFHVHIADHAVLVRRLLDTSFGLWSFQGTRIGQVDGVRAVFSRDGRIATASKEGAIQVWTRKGDRISSLAGHDAPVTAMAFTRKGDHVASGSDDGTWRVSEIVPRELFVTSLGEPPRHVEFDPSGKHILTLSGNDARVWHVEDGESTGLAASGARAASFSDGGILVLTGEELKSFGVDGSLLGSQALPLELSQGAVFAPGCVAFAVWTEAGAEIRERDGTGAVALRRAEEVVLGMAYDPEGSSVLTEDNDRVRIWSLDGRLEAELPAPQRYFARGVFGPRGRHVLTFGGIPPLAMARKATDAFVCARDGTKVATLSGHTDHLWDASFSPTGDRIVTASADRTARVWDLEGRETACLDHGQAVRSAVFSADGARVLTASADGTARLWDATGRLLAALHAPEGPLRNAVFSPRGERILTVAEDGTLRLWLADAMAVLELAKSRRTRGLTPQEREKYLLGQK